MNYKKITTFVIIGAFFAQTIHAKNVEFIENIYLEQAPQEVVELTEKVAALVDYTKPYEVAAPKKAGLQVNPWNRIISCAEVNPQTQLPYMIINPSWLASLPAEQQTFLVARCFTIFQMGALPWFFKYIGLMYLALLWVFIALLCMVLRRKSPLKTQKWWVSLLFALLASNVANYLFMQSALEKVQKNLGRRHEVQLIEATLAKTGDRDAAVQALMAIDTVIKEGAKNGEQVFVPHVELFENLANAVREPQA